MCRTDCDHGVRVARVGNAECSVAVVEAFISLETFETVVARGCDHNHAAVRQSRTFITDRRGSASSVPHVMRDRETEIGAMDGEKVVSVIQLTDVLKGGDDREFSLLEIGSEDAEIIK